MLYNTLEGGPGYWIGQLPTLVPKWRVNGVAGCYKQQVSTSLFNFGSANTKACNTMGVVQLSNRLLLAPDGLTFAGDGGMLGTAYIKTGFGKKAASDNRNAWTLVMDTQTFSGPVMYVKCY